MKARTREVLIPTREGLELPGTLVVPDNPCGIVLFAHGTGSSRHSPRNRYVARSLEMHGLATLLIDLLSEAEEKAERLTRHLRFDIDLLASRLTTATEWLLQNSETRSLPIGYFGASTGAAAALVAAAESPAPIGAIVSRGGRPDLAGRHLALVRCPTLLIVGGHDVPVLEMNREAFQLLDCEKMLEIVPGATHLFEEAGTLEMVADLAAQWFTRHLMIQVQKQLRSPEAGEQARRP